MATKNDKPNGEKAGWKLLASTTRFENEMYRLREDEVELKDGKRSTYVYVERDEAVIVVPVTAKGEIVLVKQYRYPVDEWCLEVPAGGMHDSDGATLEEVARKELLEEVGGTARSLTYVTSFYSVNSMSDEKCHVYLAQDVELSHQPRRESSESIEKELVPIEKAMELARSGAVKSAPCALALLLCEPLLANAPQQPTPDHQLET